MQNKMLIVKYHNSVVGRLALTPENLMAFEYDTAWLQNGFSISPFKLPLEKRVFIANKEPFDGVFGIFNDCLPDNWGKLLVNRELQRLGIAPNSISVLDRLAIVGKNGPGALEFEPAEEMISEYKESDLDIIANEITKIIDDSSVVTSDSITEELFRIGGSSGGTRPKIFRKFEDGDWIIKFRASVDPTDIGKQEFNIMELAQKAGLDVPDHKLFNNKYFGVKRFDRKPNGEKVFMISASGLLDADYNQPVLDYSNLLSLTAKLTRNMEEVEKIFRLMVFNILINNTDDHAKNFAFLYDGKNWKLSPAFDLTKTIGVWEHATSVNHKGKDITGADMLHLAYQVGMTDKQAGDIMLEVENTVRQ
nr:type II toxin-antitoxin system HipA family toxin [Candidatus Enterousia merdequi]